MKTASEKSSENARRPRGGFFRHLTFACLCLFCIAVDAGVATDGKNSPPSLKEILQTMQRATRFMMEKVSHQGGFVWSYLPDFSRRWGEMEAYPTMYWIQPPGTGTVGHLMLDAYHITHDEYYYRMADRSAEALIRGQHPSGGWNYMVDTAGTESLQRWYRTIGKSGWRLEEFHHDYGNATFDDGGTSEASQFLLRMYLEKGQSKFKVPLERAIRFVLESQYPSGGWPQRFPHPSPSELEGKPDYPSYITLNDNVASENIKFLILCRQSLGEHRLLEAIHRGMEAYLKLQQPAPHSGWALQYTPRDLQPAAGRSYEPKSLASQASAAAIENLLNFYQITGESKYLQRIPEALAWLEATRLQRSLLPEWALRQNRTHATYVEIGTDRPLFAHRRGSNSYNGSYFIDYLPENVLRHNIPFKQIDIAGMRRRYEQLKTIPQEELQKNSLLATGNKSPLPIYFTLTPILTSDLNIGTIGIGNRKVSGELATKLISDLNPEGYWPTPLWATSHPYRKPADSLPVTPGNYSPAMVGDEYDTSPYTADQPVLGISTAAFVKNMSTLIGYLAQNPKEE